MYIVRNITLMIGVFTLAFHSASQAQSIHGDYIETRSADVFTGPCVANGEVGLVGDQAILAWRVEEGTWNGLRLDGLSIVGVVKASATLGDPFSDLKPVKASLIVDKKADGEHQAALIDFAKEMAGNLFSDVAQVEVAPIEIKVQHHGENHGQAWLQAGAIACVQTRMLQDKDHFCKNETTYYPPLTNVSHAMPVVASLDQYQGPGLGVSWTSRGKRSAFIGTFAR